MSGDEIFALFISGVIGLIGWSISIGSLLLLKSPARVRPSAKVPVVLAIMLSVAAIFFILATWSSHDVRSSTVYSFFYLVMWFGWIGASSLLLPFVGLSWRDDVGERHNTAAGFALAGAMLGITLAFGGGNIGDGPGWWVVVFSAGLATMTLLGCWIVGNAITRTADIITIDRDIAAGLRAMGFFVGSGLILGRAVAGNWQSFDQTLLDFVIRGWPIMILTALAVLFDLLGRPTQTRLSPDRILWGVIPCLIYVLVAVTAVILQGQ